MGPAPALGPQGAEVDLGAAIPTLLPYRAKAPQGRAVGSGNDAITAPGLGREVNLDLQEMEKQPINKEYKTKPWRTFISHQIELVAKSKVTALEHWIPAPPQPPRRQSPSPLWNPSPCRTPFPLAHIPCGGAGLQACRGYQSCPRARTGTKCGTLAMFLSWSTPWMRGRSSGIMACLSGFPPHNQSERHLLLEGHEELSFTVMCYRKCVGSILGCAYLYAIH